MIALLSGALFALGMLATLVLAALIGWGLGSLAVKVIVNGPRRD